VDEQDTVNHLAELEISPAWPAQAMTPFPQAPALFSSLVPTRLNANHSQNDIETSSQLVDLQTYHLPTQSVGHGSSSGDTNLTGFPNSNAIFTPTTRNCPATHCNYVAPRRDLNRHLWTNHSDYARENGIPKEEDICEQCGYRSRKDRVKRHKDSKNHWEKERGPELDG
jgi:hypothetical protein